MRRREVYERLGAWATGWQALSARPPAASVSRINSFPKPVKYGFPCTAKYRCSSSRIVSGANAAAIEAQHVGEERRRHSRHRQDGALIRMQQGVAKLAVLAAASIKAVRQEVEPVAKLDGLHHSGAIHQGSQKFVGMFGCDSKWGQGFFREITQIVGQDHLSLSVHRRSQDVTVVFIRQGQAGNQLLVPSIRQSAVV
jgi:hypothetical protein